MYTALPFDDLADMFQAEKFLWRNCCVDSIACSRRQWARSSVPGRRWKQPHAHGQGTGTGSDNCVLDMEDRRSSKLNTRVAPGFPYHADPVGPNREKPVPVVTFYPWAMAGEAGGMTIMPLPNSSERKARLIYSRYYNLVKAPIDSNKVYALQPPVYENIARDPLCIRQLRQEAKAPSIVN